MTQMLKHAKTQKSQKTLHRLDFFKKQIEIFGFCVIIFGPIKIKTCLASQNDRLSKKLTTNGRKKAICNCPFFISIRRYFYEAIKYLH